MTKQKIMLMTSALIALSLTSCTGQKDQKIKSVFEQTEAFKEKISYCFRTEAGIQGEMLSNVDSTDATKWNCEVGETAYQYDPKTAKITGNHMDATTVSAPFSDLDAFSRCVLYTYEKAEAVISCNDFLPVAKDAFLNASKITRGSFRPDSYYYSVEADRSLLEKYPDFVTLLTTFQPSFDFHADNVSSFEISWRIKNDFSSLTTAAELSFHDSYLFTLSAHD